MFLMIMEEIFREIIVRLWMLSYICFTWLFQTVIDGKLTNERTVATIKEK